LRSLIGLLLFAPRRPRSPSYPSMPGAALPTPGTPPACCSRRLGSCRSARRSLAERDTKLTV